MEIRGKGAAPYGFRWTNGKLRIEPAEAEARRLAFELYKDLRSKGSVARRLNELGHLTRRQGAWTDIQVARILACPSAVGSYTFNKTKKIDSGTRIQTPESERQHNSCDAIVPQALWDEVQALLERQRSASRAVSRPHATEVLAGMVFCACGERMRVPHNTPRYVCAVCRNTVAVVDLDRVLMKDLDDFLRKRLEAHGTQAHDLDAIVAARGVAELEHQLAEIERQRSRVEELVIGRTISTDRFSRLDAELDRQIDSVRSRLAAAQRDARAGNGPKPPRISSQSSSSSFETFWEALPVLKRREIARAFVERLVVGDGEIEICYAFGETSPKNVSESQQTTPPTNQAVRKLSRGDPEYIRLPKSGQRCPRSGMSRTTLNGLILPTEQNGFSPPVASKSVRQKGSVRGVRLILLESLMAYLSKNG